MRYIALLLILCSFVRESTILVMHADSAHLSHSELIVENQNDLIASITYSDSRDTEALNLHWLVQNWVDLFGNRPPNAKVVFKTDQGRLQESLVILQPPHFEHQKLIFPILEVGKSYQGSLGQVMIFINTKESHAQP
ncbi:MAG: hypothetical protein S4CHLAM81_00150 [Chlamydiales bacterium]|nr:hypothetical protein [Chlamydiales bacterium]MCH9634817.1 hypothetical protein [Chlamydiales bacterium]MCH9703519.1 hypothetical protein [Chlamydiota bacterium]